MNPVMHPSNNNMLGAPDGMEDQVASLPATMATMDDGTPVILTLWEPSPQERLAIAQGAGIMLSLMGTVHPPVMMYASTPEQLTAAVRPRSPASMN